MTTPRFEPPDERKAFFIFCSGMKGRGKSYYSRSWFDGYTGDRLVIDPTHDLRDDFRQDGIEFTDLSNDLLPVKLPASYDEANPYVTCVYCPDMGSATVLDDIDRCIGLALRGRGRRCLLWLDEIGAASKGARSQPNARRLLHHGRHHNVFLLACDPRPMDIDPLWPGQADLLATFRQPVVFDSDRIADQIGYGREEYRRINQAHCKGNAFTLYDRRIEQLFCLPPIPPRRRGVNAYPVYPETPL